MIATNDRRNTMPSAQPPRRKYCPVERAVSPVIGVILMVAITVILAAVIGTMVFGLTPTEESTPPIASVTVEGEDGEANISLIHNGGDAIDLQDLSVLLNGDDIRPDDLNNTLGSGDRIHLETDPLAADDEIVLRHDPSGDLLARHQIP